MNQIKFHSIQEVIKTKMLEHMPFEIFFQFSPTATKKKVFFTHFRQKNLFFYEKTPPKTTLSNIDDLFKLNS